ncbi:hypothetical protein PGB90_001882 [Kerria lacca]
MRCKIRVILALIFVQVLIILLFWSLFKNPELFEPKISIFSSQNEKFETNRSEELLFKKILCNINGEYNISCRKELDEVYIPFTFIKKYFEIYGKTFEKNNVEFFNWSHSYANVYVPKKQYDPRGAFTHFQSYKVEERERVKCISAAEGVPLSTQWDSNGYYYPTQIAQFGLSHYSKNLMEPNPVKYIHENGENVQAYWITPYKSVVKRIYDNDAASTVFCFNNTEKKFIVLKSNFSLPILSFNLKLKPNNISRFVVTVENIVEKKIYYIHYICNSQHILIADYDIYYGLFCEGKSKWYKLSRDILIDLQKGIMLKTKSKTKLQRSSFKILNISLKGEGCIDNLTSLSSDHMTQFQLTVDWFLKHQDESTGGWPNPVTRKMAGSLILKSGWYSAMGQGHALSVLARAYFVFNKEIKYLETARKALNPFQRLSKDSGVLAMYMQGLPWYEEYPTNPPTFVLNGFIYSLIGLYDLHKLAPVGYSHEPYMLYVQGMKSLKKLLTSFDTGSGTTYDLRHVTLGTAPRLARWDYHATHVNQLYLLSSIDNDPLFSITAKRWLGYMYGKRASHN